MNLIGGVEVNVVNEEATFIISKREPYSELTLLRIHVKNKE